MTTTVSTKTDSSLQIKNARLLTVMRLVWLLTLVGVVYIHVVAVPAYYQFIKERNQDPSTPRAEGLRQLGLPVSTYVIIVSAAQALAAVVYVAGAILLFYVRSENWMAWVFSLALLGLSVLANSSFAFLPLARSELAVITIVLYILFSPILGIAVFCFPDGRLFPSWAKWFIVPGIAWQLFNIYYVLFILRLHPFDVVGEPAWNVPVILLVLGGTLSRIPRYKHSSPAVRQQTKWVGYGLTIWAIFLVLDFRPFQLSPNILAIYILISHNLLNLSSIVLVTCVGIAITRYRLWDINVVIHRTLVYGLAALILAGLFLGGAYAIQALIGNQSGLTLVALLIVGVLFNPVRKRVQHVIDRRLYGFRFDLDQLKAAQKLPEIKNPGLLSGRTLDSYQVLDVLGRGGMGEVYKGHGDGKTVAIKVMSDEGALDPENRARFEREGRALSQLDHPHIVKCFGSGEADGLRFMVLEFVAGRDLAALLRERGKISLDEACPILEQIASALDYAHDLGYVHRDIKPSNVMLRQNADPALTDAVLMDFGVAKAQEAQGVLTGSNAVGTIAYMAPEQILTSRSVDRRADVYAIGVMLFQILSGELPFQGSPAQILFGHLQQPVPEINEPSTAIPWHVREAIRRAMAKNPEERYPTAGAFAAALNEW